MTIALDDIRPDEAGKYSDSLYRWVRRFMQRYRLDTLPRAYLTDTNLVCNQDPQEALKLHADYITRCHLWLGVYATDGLPCVIGVCASDLVNPNQKTSSTSSWALPQQNPQEVTAWFWKRYVEQGQCFLLGNIRHEWIQINRNSRKCRHCGKHERRHVRTLRRIERVEEWREMLRGHLEDMGGER